MILTAALLSVGNCARGNATISHWQWLVYAAFVIFSAMPLQPEASLLWLLVTVVITMRATGPSLLAAVNNDKKGIWKGVIRNLPIIPLLLLLHSWMGLILLFQGGLYWICGRVYYPKATRIAEGISGAVLGLLM